MIYAKLNRYLYFHETHDHQTGHQALFFMTTCEPYGNNFQFLMTMVAILINLFIGETVKKGEGPWKATIFLGLIFWGAIFRGGKFLRWEIS